MLIAILAVLFAVLLLQILTIYFALSAKEQRPLVLTTEPVAPVNPHTPPSRPRFLDPIRRSDEILADLEQGRD